MLAFDTSSIVYAWDNYPINQFPPLWRWISERIGAEDICMSEVVLAEAVTVSPDCRNYLAGAGMRSLPVTDDILQEALRMKGLLNIGVRYGPGVGESDLLIIATSSVHGVALVSNESSQPNRPAVMSKYKIPLVCALPDVKVECLDFLEYLRRSRAVFQ